MAERLDVCILIATRDRPCELARTLSAFGRLDTSDVAYEIVIAANTDAATAAVLDEHASRLPLDTVRRDLPGKSRAINALLDRRPTARIVLFTDDDVEPDPAWLREVVRSCEAHPDVDVFGGKIDLAWPSVGAPEWLRHDETVLAWAFSRHDLGATPRPYRVPAELPFGPNFWVRRAVIDSGVRFSEHLGPHPSSRTMGAETSFLRAAVGEGRSAWYVPAAVVRHAVRTEYLTLGGLRLRAERLGRGVAHLDGVPREDLLRRSPRLWSVLARLRMLHEDVIYAWTRLASAVRAQPARSLAASIRRAYHKEAIAVGRGRGGAP